MLKLTITEEKNRLMVSRTWEKGIEFYSDSSDHTKGELLRLFDLSKRQLEECENGQKDNLKNVRIFKD